MFLSVLLPTLGKRNAELERLLCSLNNQSYKNFEVIIISQLNHIEVENLIKKWNHLNIKQIKINEKGISIARNEGIKYCNGDWIVLSDDDCWYPKDAFINLKECVDKFEFDILLTQIYDPIQGVPYKNYLSKYIKIKNRYQLMSKSSIEIMFKNKISNSKFDVNFGLGSKYPCGEEIDFLLNHYSKCNIVYCPIITVYHPKKESLSNNMQVYAKGALYAKHFNKLIGYLILFRDKLLKHEDNKIDFWNGYNVQKGLSKNEDK